MVEFETIKSEEIKFGTNNFIEVAKKKAITEEGENTFISVARGFYTQDGQKRWKKSFSLPMDEALVKDVSKKLIDVIKE